MDYGHELSDEMLAKVERTLKREYTKAAKGIQETAREYLKQFEKDDAKMLSKLKRGDITEKEYLDWRRQQIMLNSRWGEMQDTIAEDLKNVNAIASDIIRDHTNDVYALNHNFGTFEAETGANINTSYTLYDRDTVAKLVRDNPTLLPAPGVAIAKAIKEGRAKRWNQQKVNSVMLQGILQGDSIPRLAKRLAETVGESNLANAVRAARTMTTGAESAGREDSYRRVNEMYGLDIRKEWSAVIDGRTRHSHIQLNGVSVPVDEEFPNHCKFPGDPEGPAGEVYNCRCTLVADMPFLDKVIGKDELTQRLSKENYEQWLKDHQMDGYSGRKVKQKRRMDIEDVGRKPSREGLASEQFHEERRRYNERRDKWVEQEMPKKSMSLEELDSWCKRNDVVIRTSMSEVDGRMLTAYTQRMGKLFSDFPDVKNYRRYIDFGQYGIPEQFLHYQLGFDRNADYFAEAGFGMTFGPSFADAKEALRDKLHLTSIGHLTRGDGTINQIFDHEFGHNVMSWMVHKDKMTMQQRLDFEDDIVKSLMGKKGMSDYATTNPDELFAEAFSAWYGGEKTEFAMAMGKFLKKHGVIK